MKHYLTFKDDKSDKFWQIENNGKSFTVTYGKTGSTGTKQIKKFANEKKCLNEVEKLLNEKLKKGYQEAKKSAIVKSYSKASVKTDYLREWEAIVNAKDLTKALVNHFAYLADTPGFEPVLKAIMETATQAICTKECLTIEHSSGDIMMAFPPLTKVPKKFPLTYQKILAKHERLTLSNCQVTLGEHGCFNEEDGWFDGLEEEESVLLDLIDPKDIICPIWDYSDGWLYHPKEKNGFGEPVIYYISHEGGDIDDPQPLNAGALFLKRAAEGLELDVEIPVIGLSASSGKNDFEKWWNSLDKHWKKLLKEDHDITKASQAKQVSEITELYCDEDFSSTTIEPVRIMQRLTNFTLESGKIKDLSPISDLKRLEKVNLSKTIFKDFGLFHNPLLITELSLAETRIEDISDLSKFRNLYYLNIAGNKIKNFTAVRNLIKLKLLDISNTPIKSLAFLSGMTLNELTIDGTSITSLAPANITEIIYCRGNSGITFEEALRFTTNSKGAHELRIVGSYRETHEKFVAEIDRIDFNLDGLKNTLSSWIIEEYEWLQQKSEKQLAEKLLQAAQKHGLTINKMRPSK